MAQYDGSIRINTNINTDGIARGMVEIRQVIERGMSASKPMKNTEQEVKQLGDSMSDTAQKASELKNAMESQKNAQVPTKEYSDLEKEVNSLEKKLLSVYDRQEKFLATGGKEDSSTYQRMVYDAEALEKKLQNAEQAMETLVNSGKAFTLGADLDAEYWKQQEENIDRIIARLEEKRQKEAETPPELLQPRYDRPEVESWQRGASLQEGQRMAQALADAMTSVGQNAQEAATKSNEAIASMTQELAELKARQKELESQGQGLGFEEYDANVQRIAEINDALSNYRRELTDTEVSYIGLKESAQNAFKMMSKGLRDIPIAIVKVGIKGITSAVRELGNVVKKTAITPFKMLGVIAKKTFSSIGKSSKSSNNIFNKGFKNILKYGLGIRSFYRLINKLRTAIKDGFSNFANYSGSFKNAVNGLKGSALTLKNSFAAAFSPLVEMAIPYIQRVIDYLVKLMDIVGQVMAALTGQKNYTRAIKQTTGALKEQNKAQNKQLSGLDKLNNLSSDKGGGSDNGAGEMFEEAPVDDRWQNVAQWLKDMWEASDFYDLGKVLGEKLKEALDNIPWDEIKEKARNLGKSLATLINGFIEVEGLGYSIGRTLAEAFNTGFEFLNAFVHELHWDSLGKFIAETLNGIFENIDWDLIYDTFVTGAKGLGDAINSFTDNLNWDAIATTISNFVNTFVDTIYTFITTVNWSELGTKIGTTISDAWTGIDWAKAGETLGEYFKAFFDFVGKAIETVDWQEVGKTVKDFIIGIDWAGVAESFFEAIGAVFGGFAAFLWGLIEDAWNSVVEWWHETAFEDGEFTIEGLLDGIGSALKNIGTWIYKHIFEPFIRGFKSAFGIHSPSKVMIEMGGYIVSGLLEGLKEKWKNVVNWITDKINWLKDKLSGIAGKVTSAFTGGGNSNAKTNKRSALFSTPAVSTPYAANPAFAALSTTPIPKLATGAVIPANKEFLAVLGDQKHGTNIEAPLEMIKQANKEGLLEILNQLGLPSGGGGQEINLNLTVECDGHQLLHLMQKLNREYFKQTGRNAFIY